MHASTLPTPWLRSAALALVLAGGLAQAQAAPPFYGNSFASTRGAGDPVIGRSGGPVRVGAHLPPALACSEVVAVETGPGYHENPGLNAFNAAPVRVVLAAGRCGSGWQAQWVNFTVPHPGRSDILHLVFQDGTGRTLHSEKLAISTSAGSPTGGDD